MIRNVALTFSGFERLTGTKTSDRTLGGIGLGGALGEQERGWMGTEGWENGF